MTACSTPPLEAAAAEPLGLSRCEPPLAEGSHTSPLAASAEFAALTLNAQCAGETLESNTCIDRLTQPTPSCLRGGRIPTAATRRLTHTPRPEQGAGGDLRYATSLSTRPRAPIVRLTHAIVQRRVTVEGVASSRFGCREVLPKAPVRRPARGTLPLLPWPRRPRPHAQADEVETVLSCGPAREDSSDTAQQRSPTAARPTTIGGIQPRP